MGLDLADDDIFLLLTTDGLSFDLAAAASLLATRELADGERFKCPLPTLLCAAEIVDFVLILFNELSVVARWLGIDTDDDDEFGTPISRAERRRIFISSDAAICIDDEDDVDEDEFVGDFRGSIIGFWCPKETNRTVI